MLNLAGARRAPISDDQDEVARVISEICARYGRVCARLARDEGERLSFPERRERERTSLEIPFYLREAIETKEGVFCSSHEPLIAVTRDLSPRGIGFQTDDTLDSPLALAEFDMVGAGPLQLLIEIRWKVRKSRHSLVAGASVLGVVCDDAET